MISIADIRAQFPILGRKVNGAPLVYFDNAATTHKPERVIGAMSGFYRHSNANIHRGVHTLSREATDLYEQARSTVASFFNVKDAQQVVFTAGTTDSVNIVAQGLAVSWLKPGDEVIVSTYEHHSNILPWQLWAQRSGGAVKAIALGESHALDYASLESLINERTKLIAIAHVSNTLGVVSDLARVRELCWKNGIALFIDGAQSAPHMKVDLSALDPDFFACSAHKMYGPTGSGMLYLSPRWLKELPVTRPGGGTIRRVTFAATDYAEGALRYEPGTPNVAGAIGFAEALRFMNETGVEAIAAHERSLAVSAQEMLKKVERVQLYGYDLNKAAVISFNVEGLHPLDVGTILDKYGIAVRTGHHCTQPLMQCLGTEGTVRISFAVYNEIAEIDRFIGMLQKSIKMLS